MYGKTIQNVRGYINVRIHNEEHGLLDAISDPTLKRYSILGENLVQTNHEFPVIEHKQPIIIGFTILELVIKKIFKMFNFIYFQILI